jgi:hypothetical protein
MRAADELANESGKEHLGANDHGQHANVKQRRAGYQRGALLQLISVIQLVCHDDARHDEPNEK